MDKLDQNLANWTRIRQIGPEFDQKMDKKLNQKMDQKIDKVVEIEQKWTSAYPKWTRHWQEIVKKWIRQILNPKWSRTMKKIAL